MSAPRPAAVVVLAAGEGTRMRSSLPKVLHALAGRSLLGHAIAAARTLLPEHLAVVVRHEREKVAAHALELDPGVSVVDQDAVKGTGRAVWCALEALGDVREGTVVVTYGDVPLLSGQLLARLAADHHASGVAATVLTAVVADPTGYGRVIRDVTGAVTGIIEHRDADADQLAVHEINSGVYAFDVAVLRTLLDRLQDEVAANAQGEVYLTDVVSMARAAGCSVGALATGDVWQVEGVNDRAQLAALGAELNRRVVTGWMYAGVTVLDPATTWVDVTVRLAADVTLLPGTQLHGATTVEAGAVLGPDTTLTDCVVGTGASVVRSHGTGARLRDGASVGPFSYLRPGTDLGSGGRIGAFVETKNAVIGTGSKVPHLSYVGDAVIGEHTNIGAATVFVNYDGVAKHHIRVGDHARIGSDTMLVAPLTIGDGAYTAAGSVITQDVPAGDLGVARGRQRNIEGWVASRRPGSTSAAAAADGAGTAGGPAGTVTSADDGRAGPDEGIGHA